MRLILKLNLNKMKIKTFIKYLENLREDEFGHLNDKLSANKKNEGRWDDDYDYDDDSTKNYSGYGEYDDWYEDDDQTGKKSSNPKFDDDDDDYGYEDGDDDDDVQHLTYLLRQMFRNSGVDDVHITAKGNEDIVCEIYMAKKETLRNVIKVFEVANKLKRDILAQYDAEFEIWQSKAGGGILSFGFTLDEGLDDDNMPF